MRDLFEDEKKNHKLRPDLIKEIEDRCQFLIDQLDLTFGFILFEFKDRRSIPVGFSCMIDSQQYLIEEGINPEDLFDKCLSKDIKYQDKVLNAIDKICKEHGKTTGLVICAEGVDGIEFRSNDRQILEAVKAKKLPYIVLNESKEEEK